MKNILIIVLVLFFTFTAFVSASVDINNVGFVNSSLWFDREPFFSGEKVRMYTTIANSSSSDFEGVVEFYEGKTLLNKDSVKLERNGDFQVVWADWTPKEGNYEISVKISNVKLTALGGESQSVEYDKEPVIVSRFIDTDTDGDLLGNKEDLDDDNDGIKDNEDENPLISDIKVNDNLETDSVRENINDKSTDLLLKIGEIASSTTPKIASAIEGAFSEIEEFRIQQSDNVDKKIKQVKQKIAEDNVGSDEISIGEEKKKNDPFNQLQLLALTTAGYTLSHKIAFYIVGIFILYLIFKKIIPWIYGIVRGRE